MKRTLALATTALVALVATSLAVGKGSTATRRARGR